MSKTINGGCLCGQVKFTVQDEFFSFKLCHCSMCRKISGSAHVANLFTKPDNIQWLSGEDAISSYDIPNNQVRRVFCSTCGTSLPFVSQSGKIRIVPAGSLEEQPSSMQPEHAIFWADRMPWYDQVHQLQHFDEYPT